MKKHGRSQSLSAGVSGPDRPKLRVPPPSPKPSDPNATESTGSFGTPKGLGNGGTTPSSSCGMSDFDREVMILKNYQHQFIVGILALLPSAATSHRHHVLLRHCLRVPM